MENLVNNFNSRRRPLSQCNIQAFSSCFRMKQSSAIQNCFDNVMQQHSVPVNCKFDQLGFENRLKKLQELQKRELELYLKNVAIVDEKLADIDEEKKHHREIMDDHIKRIDMLKQEKREKRVKLLNLK